jgi:hypothetical protein
MAAGPALLGKLFFHYFSPKGCCQKITTIILSIVLGTVANPVVWVGCLIYLGPKTITLYRLYHDRKGVEKDSVLPERLLADTI